MVSQALIPLKWQPLAQRLLGTIHLVGGLEQVGKGWPQTGCVLSVAPFGPVLKDH